MKCNWLKCISLVFLIVVNGQETGLPDYVVSECYGDIFSFDCGAGNKIRINRDFFGYSEEQACRYSRGDCIISNPKSNSLIHRYCTGHRVCTYYLVERRGCGGAYSNYQQVEYQCIPDTKITNICETAKYETTSTYIASPNFPENYPPNVDCRCIVSSTDPDEKVQLEVVYLAVKYTWPCKDWLQIGRRRTCGTNVDLYQGRNIPISFHSDKDESHSGFWLHFQSSGKDSKILVRCGNETLTPPPPVTRKPPTTTPEEPSTTTESVVAESEKTEPTTLPPPSGGDERQDQEVVSNDRALSTDDENNQEEDISNEERTPQQEIIESSENEEEDNEDDKKLKTNSPAANMRPTVPPNLPFADISRDGDGTSHSKVIDSTVIDDHNQQNGYNPNFSDNGKNANIHDNDSDDIAEEADDQTQEKYQPSFPISNEKNPLTPLQGREADKINNSNEDNLNRGTPEQRETTPVPIRYYPDPANDIPHERRNLPATTSTTTSPPTSTTTATTKTTAITTLTKVNTEIDNIRESGVTLDNVQKSDKKYTSEKSPKDQTLWPGENTGNSWDDWEQQSNTETDEETNDVNDYEVSRDNSIAPSSEPADSIPSGNTESYENQQDFAEQIPAFPDDTSPPAVENKIPSQSGETLSPNSNENQPPEIVSVNNGDVNFIEDHHGFTNDVNTPVKENNKNQYSEKSNDNVQGRETNHRFPDLTNIHTIHDGSNSFDTNAHPVDLNLPGVTGGNFTFNSTTTNSTVITKSAKEEDGGIITLGLLILCICIGVGIFLVVCVLLGIYCRRKRRRRDNQIRASETNATKKKSIVVVGVNQDNDSDPGLLVMGNGRVKGHGHSQGHLNGHSHSHNHARGNGHPHRKIIVGPLEHPLYNTRSKRADKSMQIDFDSESDYDDVMMYNRDYTLEDIDSEVSSVQSSSSPFNNKCVQVRTSRPYMTTVRPGPHGHGTHDRHGGVHGRLSMSPPRNNLPMSPGRPPRPPVTPPRYGVPQQLKRSHGISDISDKINQKPYPPRRPPSRHPANAMARNSTVGVDVNYIINDIHVEPTHNYNPQRRKHSLYRISDSEVDSFNGSDTDAEKIKRESLASMSELAEMTMSPENTMEARHMNFSTDSEGSDWDQRSAISI